MMHHKAAGKGSKDACTRAHTHTHTHFLFTLLTNSVFQKVNACVVNVINRPAASLPLVLIIRKPNSCRMTSITLHIAYNSNEYVQRVFLRVCVCVCVCVCECMCII